MLYELSNQSKFIKSKQLSILLIKFIQLFVKFLITTILCNLYKYIYIYMCVCMYVCIDIYYNILYCIHIYIKRKIYISCSSKCETITEG